MLEAKNSLDLHVRKSVEGNGSLPRESMDPPGEVSKESNPTQAMKAQGLL